MKTVEDFIKALRPVCHSPRVEQDALRLASRDDAAQTVDRLEVLALRQQRSRWRSIGRLHRLRSALYKVAKCGSVCAPFALVLLSGCSPGSHKSVGFLLLCGLAYAAFFGVGRCLQGAKWQAELARSACAAAFVALAAASALSIVEQGLHGRSVDCHLALGAMPSCTLNAPPPNVDEAQVADAFWVIKSRGLATLGDLERLRIAGLNSKLVLVELSRQPGMQKDMELWRSAARLGENYPGPTSDMTVALGLIQAGAITSSSFENAAIASLYNDKPSGQLRGLVMSGIAK